MTTTENIPFKTKLRKTAREFFYITLLAVITGSAVALFLWLLDIATSTFQSNRLLVYFLPLAGILIYFLYRLQTKKTEGGNDLVIAELMNPKEGIPRRMAPLILFSTVVTHLFGGSAGREGTAIQMGAGLSATLSHWFRKQIPERSLLLRYGMAAGFGAVFGTPLAGAAFAMEVTGLKKVHPLQLQHCLFAAVVADFVCRLYGIKHTDYHFQLPAIAVSPRVMALVILASILFGLTAKLFIHAQDTIKRVLNAYFSKGWMVPLFGGCVLILLTAFAGGDYLGLGVKAAPGHVSILSSFHPDGADHMSWLWKLVFTAITLGSGFKGGEVTPLFFIGACLGNTIAMLTGVPVAVFAAMGFVAVFAGATKTPIACTIMAAELFGVQFIGFYAVACLLSYFTSGKSSLYKSQEL